jgi:proteic killer suppression protein
VIVSFKDKEPEKIFRLEASRRLPSDIQRSARRRLLALNGASSILDLREPPSNHLEKLTGDREGQYSIRVNEQWRVCFIWHDNNAHEVEVVDYQ